MENSASAPAIGIRKLRGRPRKQTPGAQTGALVARIRQRKINLKSVPGTLREISRVYRMLDSGELSFEQAEVRSRVLRRAGELARALEEREMTQEALAFVRDVRSGAITLAPPAGYAALLHDLQGPPDVQVDTETEVAT